MAEQKKKRYYSISEVSKMLDVKQHILRYWEGEFSKLRPRKNRAGNRSYTERDIKIVMLIKNLLYEEKYTIEGAKKHIKADSSIVDDLQIDIPFEKIKTKNEIDEVRAELFKLIDMVEEL